MSARSITFSLNLLENFDIKSSPYDNDINAKLAEKWGRKATGPVEVGSRVARSDHCIGPKGNAGFFVSFLRLRESLGRFL